MAYVENIIGFDAREMWYFDNNEKAIKTVLSQNIKKVLSVDTSIWGSVFDNGEYPNVLNAEREKYGLGRLFLPEDIGMNRPFWANLENLESYVTRSETLLQKPIFIVAITKVDDMSSGNSVTDQWPYPSATFPKEIISSYHLLGYDITTHDSEHSITNSLQRVKKEVCGTGNNLLTALNEFCLFNDIENAIEFKHMEDKLWPQDSPHIVFGIWLVKKLE